MDFSDILRRAAAGEQLSVSPQPLTDEEREEMKRQREMAMNAAMQAGPMMGTIGKFGGIRGVLQGGKGQPSGALKEASYEAPNLGKLEQADEVLRETMRRSAQQPKEIPSKEMSAEEFEQIMKLFGGK